VLRQVQLSWSQIPEGSIWRYGQAGDLPGKGNRIDKTKLMQLVAVNKGKQVICYTHKPVLGKSKIAVHNRAALRLAKSRGWITNLSANSIEHADQLHKLGVGPVCTVLPEGTRQKHLLTKAGHTVVVCPATYNTKITCKSCQLCARERDTIVGFPAHGTGRKKVEQVCAAGL